MHRRDGGKRSGGEGGGREEGGGLALVGRYGNPAICASSAKCLSRWKRRERTISSPPRFSSSPRATLAEPSMRGGYRAVSRDVRSLTFRYTLLRGHLNETTTKRYHQVRVEIPDARARIPEKISTFSRENGRIL